MIDLITNPESVRVSKSEASTQIFGEIYFQIGDSFSQKRNGIYCYELVAKRSL